MVTPGEFNRAGTARRTDPVVKVALISAAATVIAAVVTAVGAFATGWLQYSGPGSGAGQNSTVTSPVVADQNRPTGAAVGTPSTPASGATTSLLDLVPLSGGLVAGPQTVGGTRYGRTLSTAGCGDPNFTNNEAVYQLDRRYTRLTAMVGPNDAVRSSEFVDLQVIIDDEQKAARTVAAGVVQQIDVDLTGALRLELRANCASGPGAAAVWIDPVVVQAA